MKFGLQWHWPFFYRRGEVAEGSIDLSTPSKDPETELARARALFISSMENVRGRSRELSATISSRPPFRTEDNY